MGFSPGEFRLRALVLKSSNATTYISHLYFLNRANSIVPSSTVPNRSEIKSNA